MGELNVKTSTNNKWKYNKINILILGFFLFSLIIVFSFGTGQAVAASNSNIYVNASSGNDNWDGQYATFQSGTLHGPKLSIKNATKTITAGGTVNIENGKYTGIKNNEITIDKNMIIIGQSKTATIINGTGIDWIFHVNNGIKLIIKNLQITNGTTNLYGGAIYNDGNLTVNNTIFSNNTATESGGAILNSAIMTVNNSIFTNNEASYGSAFLNDRTVIVNNCTFTNNIGDTINNGGTMTVNNCIFINNTSEYGGAINNDAQSVISNVTASKFINNSGTYGGAIYNNYGTLNIKSCSFTGNFADNGGAINNYDIINIADSIFTSNRGGSGGAIDNRGSMTITRSNFTGNNGVVGGGIHNWSTLSVTGSSFTGNTANSGNGGAIDTSGTANINFNRIVGNTAANGNAIYLDTGSGPYSIEAEYNWWGNSTGPTSGFNGMINGFTVNKWLVLKINAFPISVQSISSSKITADLRYDNFGTLHTEGYLPNGLKVNFTTTLGSILSSFSTMNGIAYSYVKSTKIGTATVSAKLDNQTKTTTVKIIDTIPPKVSTTTPTNLKTGISRTSTIAIKFSENIKASVYWSKIVLKDKYGHAVHITTSISGTTIFIKTNKRAANTWYTVTIPKASIKDIAGNNLAANYTFKFKTGK